MKKTTYNNNLRTPDSITVEVGNNKKDFKYPEENKLVGEYIKRKIDESFGLLSAYVYYNIDWDCDHVLYCKYEL